MLASLKLIDLVEKNSEYIAKQWAKDVQKNPKTPYYHNVPEDKVIPQAIRFYDQFRRIFTADKPFETARTFFSSYAEDRYKDGVPMHEAIYALIMMRRHIWLYAEFQAVFISAVEQKQAVDSITRTMLMFDYAMYSISQKYQELVRSEIDKKLDLGAINVLRMEGDKDEKQGVKVGIMAALLFAAGLLTYHYHAGMGQQVLFTHLFYIPIVLASIWWKKSGIIIAFGLGVLLMASHAVFLKGVSFADDFIRAIMFFIIGSVVGLLAEGVTKAEEIYHKTIK
jgi:hypothetical protein